MQIYAQPQSVDKSSVFENSAANSIELPPVQAIPMANYKALNNKKGTEKINQNIELPRKMLFLPGPIKKHQKASGFSPKHYL